MVVGRRAWPGAPVPSGPVAVVAPEPCPELEPGPWVATGAVVVVVDVDDVAVDVVVVVVLLP